MDFSSCIGRMAEPFEVADLVVEVVEQFSEGLSIEVMWFSEEHLQMLAKGYWKDEADLTFQHDYHWQKVVVECKNECMRLGPPHFHFKEENGHLVPYYGLLTTTKESGNCIEVIFLR